MTRTASRAGSPEHDPQRLLELVAARRSDDIHRVCRAPLPSAGTTPALPCRLLERAGTDSPLLIAASAARTPGPPAFVRMPIFGPCSRGWSASSFATLNISSIVVTLITPACLNSASTATSDGRERSGMRTCRPAAHLAPARLDRDDRLFSGDAPGDPAEAAGIAEGLEIQQDDPGILIVLPEFQQVVRGDVHPVPDAREMGDPQVIALHVIEQRQAEGAAVRADAQIAARRPHPGEGCVQVHGRVGVHDPQAIGPDAPHAVGKHLFPEKPLPLLSFGTAFSEAGGNDHDAPDALSAALVDHVENFLRGYDYHGKVDVAGEYRRRTG